MFTFLNHGAKITRIPSRILAITTLAVVATVITALAFSSFTAQAQEPAGSINNQLVSSPHPGQLVITWDSPNETPTDYRVRWAPANQDYLSYSVENTSERGSAYPEALTFTVDNLPAEIEYKVQVRARYYDGDNTDSPWSGPWTAEATVTISSPPEQALRRGNRPSPVEHCRGAVGHNVGPAFRRADRLPRGVGAGQRGLPLLLSRQHYPSWQLLPRRRHLDVDAHRPTGWRQLQGHDARSLPRRTDERRSQRSVERQRHPEGAEQPADGAHRDSDGHRDHERRPDLNQPVVDRPNPRRLSPATSIWRGRGRRLSNHVLVQDTGDTATTYTDATAQEGNTHVYAVTALSPDGDSPTLRDRNRGSRPP